jgi:hypothetical protein
METDAQAYTGLPLAIDAEREAMMASIAHGTAAQVERYRAALAEAARTGTLSDERGGEIADEILKLAAASSSAVALIAFERALHAARLGAKAWSNGKTDRDSKVMALESLATDAAERLQVDLTCLEY